MQALAEEIKEWRIAGVHVWVIQQFHVGGGGALTRDRLEVNISS